MCYLTALLSSLDKTQHLEKCFSAEGEIKNKNKKNPSPSDRLM